MSAQILAWSTLTAQAMLALAMALAVFRMIRGPSAQDRVLAFDTMYLGAMLLILVLGVAKGVKLYFEAALIVALLGFVGTIALARFLLRGEVIE